MLDVLHIDSDCNPQQHQAEMHRLEQGPGIHRLWRGRWAFKGTADTYPTLLLKQYRVIFFAHFALQNGSATVLHIKEEEKSKNGYTAINSGTICSCFNTVLIIFSGVEVGGWQGWEGEGSCRPLQPLHEPDARGTQRADSGQDR